jgi:exopolyphosphatase/guanosine-5'-triphosphate,3'-diphosphate pyrophosphatase
MRVAALDLGSNTFLLLIADLVKSDGVWRIKQVVEDRVKVTRLAQGVNASGVLAVESLKRAEQCFRDFKKVIDSSQVDQVVAVATSAARDARNSSDFFQLAEGFNIPIRIISGAKEAELTYSGATAEVADNRGLCVVDVGGGSTEIICKNREGQLLLESLDVGSVRLDEMFFPRHPVKPTEIARLEDYILKMISGSQVEQMRGQVDQLFAVAGTPTTLAALHMGLSFDGDRVDGYELNRESILQWRDRLGQMTSAKRLELPGMQKGREDVIVAGASILNCVASYLQAPKINVSTKGVRYGLATHWDQV